MSEIMVPIGMLSDEEMASFAELPLEAQRMLIKKGRELQTEQTRMCQRRADRSARQIAVLFDGVESRVLFEDTARLRSACTGVRLLIVRQSLLMALAIAVFGLGEGGVQSPRRFPCGVAARRSPRGSWPSSMSASPTIAGRSWGPPLIEWAWRD